VSVQLPMPVVRPASRDNPEARELAAALRRAVRGEVRFDLGTRAAYSTDASNYRQVPTGVVIPRDLDDVVAAVAVCREYDAPVFSRGGGTSLGGQCTNAAVMLDMAKYCSAVESVDAERRVAVVQAGCVLDELNKAARAEGGLVFGPKPATHDHCTIGGMLGNNSCGSTAQWSGTTAANVRRLEVLTYDGVRAWVGPTDDAEYQRLVDHDDPRAAIYRALREFRDRYADAIRARYPRIPRRISGYNLPDLLPENGFNVARALVGSESTCVTILRAELDLLPEPAHLALLLVGYDDIATAGDQVPVANGHHPIILEGLDHRLLRYELDRRMNTAVIHDLPEVGAWLMTKVAGDSAEEAEARAHELAEAMQKAGPVRHIRILTDHEHQAELDSVREAALGATSRVPGFPDAWPGWEDSAVAPEQVGEYLRRLRELLDEFGFEATSLYGHLGHGCVHNSIPFELSTVDGVAAFRRFVTRAAQLVHSFGGSLSGEHGDGQARGELLDVIYGDELVRAFNEFKAIFDPNGRMNPGKVVRANPLDSELRLGTEYRPPSGPTHFSYPGDGGFAGVPTRCFGVGACRRRETDSGVMCPSYLVTREEEHSTRGRMRLLFEMARGETITDGWRSTEVHDALDLCLACKGCKSDCPVSVDMATYKAEFLAHHYQGRLRPRAHYSLGWLPLAARLAAPAPWAANALTHAPGLGKLAKRLAGVDPQRDVPRFAPRRFTDAYRRRGPRGSGERGSVVLWPDTFTNSFTPRVAAAAVTALEAAGYRVVLPDGPVCCGLTWISTGQLGIARRVLTRSLRTLAPLLRAGLPVVGLEPSCTSVLRSDAADLLAADPVDPSSAVGRPGGGPAVDAQLRSDVRRLREQTRTFAELLNQTPDFAPRLAGRPVKALVQTHCHQHAVLGDAADRELMGRIGLDAEVLDSGCCGLAGDFGMTPEHRDVSLACAERVLLPRVRSREEGTLVLADGFSCRTQLADQEPAAQPVHLAELVARAVAQSR
jgi:FAD/FMN-containing dehydrogenase/Fe-S oxidoreductase